MLVCLRVNVGPITGTSEWSYFGKTGIEYTFGRVPVAGTDFSERFYSYDDVPGDVDLEHFSLTDEDFSLKIPLIELARSSSRRGVKLLASPWTPPSWMKTNNNYKAGYLLSKYYPTWVNYLLKFLEAYNENGIEFWGLSQGNEFVLGLFVPFEMPNLIMLPAQLRELTKNYFGPMFKNSSFKDIHILTMNDERPFTSWWDKRLLDDEETAKYIDGVALHWYFDTINNTYILDEHHEKHPDKFILYTESSIGSLHGTKAAVKLGSWDNAVRYIEDIFQVYNHWSIGFIDWNLALDEDGGPTFVGMHLDAAIIINTTNGEFYKQPSFYVLGHFSKFIQPGSIKVQMVTNQKLDFQVDELEREYFNENKRDPFPPGPPFLTAFSGQPPTGETEPTTKAGPGPSPAPASNIVLALATSNPDGGRTVIVYNPRAVPVTVILTDPDMGTIKQTIAAHSINTFLYW